MQTIGKLAVVREPLLSLSFYCAISLFSDLYAGEISKSAISVFAEIEPARCASLFVGALACPLTVLRTLR